MADEEHAPFIVERQHPAAGQFRFAQPPPAPAQAIGQPIKCAMEPGRIR
jgi:hypothetical protein